MRKIGEEEQNLSLWKQARNLCITGFFTFKTSMESVYCIATAFKSFLQLYIAFYYIILQLSSAFYIKINHSTCKYHVADRRRSRVDSTSSSSAKTESVHYRIFHFQNKHGIRSLQNFSLWRQAWNLCITGFFTFKTSMESVHYRIFSLSKQARKPCITVFSPFKTSTESVHYSIFHFQNKDGICAFQNFSLSKQAWNLYITGFSTFKTSMESVHYRIFSLQNKHGICALHHFSLSNQAQNLCITWFFHFQNKHKIRAL